MRVVLLFVALSLCSACVPHNKPVANIQFSSVTSADKVYESLREVGGPIVIRNYTMHFTSNIEMLELFKKEDGTNPLVSARLVCALEDDTNFSVKHNMQRYVEDGIKCGGLERKSQGNVFNYISEFDFFETKDDGGSESRLEKQELNNMLSQKREIPCKVVITVYLSTPYYSNAMYVPVKDILREVNK